MEDNIKGILVTLTIIGLFMTAIMNFIVLFPQEQGVTFSDSSDSNSYLIMSQNNDSGTVSSLTSINNQSDSAFNQWDITTGYMGTNQLKQGKSGIFSMVTNTFSNLGVIASQLFSSGSPIIYALLVMSVLAGGYLTYAFIKFLRTGN
jgi:hypothetical protein